MIREEFFYVPGTLPVPNRNNSYTLNQFRKDRRKISFCKPWCKQSETHKKPMYRENSAQLLAYVILIIWSKKISDGLIAMFYPFSRRDKQLKETKLIIFGTVFTCNASSKGEK
jgi:hypothetical protein